jgi:methylaspartate mutase epsilon subunit
MSSFGRFVVDAAATGRLVVQPRMGFSDPRRMRAGLERTRFAAATTVGTVTLDSYTRLGDHRAVRRALASGSTLNGYPIVAYPVHQTRALLDGVLDESFPVQVRHGSARPQRIIRALSAAGLDATEGGPVSYCVPHLETFGGCLLGQLCPPGLLVAISLLEALFFTQNGVGSVSLSYAQQTDPVQDEEAIRALRRLAGEFLPPHVDRHVVLYTYMGVYPMSVAGAQRLLETAAELAVRSGAERLIVKTVAEAHRIPTIEENVRALETAATVAAVTGRGVPHTGTDGEVYAEARTFVEAVLELADDTGRALQAAFARGYLDVPFCLHPDNAGRSRSFIDDGGRLRWSAVGRMPISPDAAPGDRAGMTSTRLLAALHHMAGRFDQ